MLKKSLQGLALLVSLVPAAHAGDWYLGLDLGLLGFGQEEWSGSGLSSEEYKFSASSRDFKGGYEFDSNNRLELVFTKIDIDFDDSEYSSETYSGMDIDYQWVWGKGEALQPYLGLGLGFYTYDDFRDDAGDELNGVSFNLMGGIQYSVTDRVDLDLGYKYRGISWQEILVGWYTVDVRSPVSLVTAGVTVKVF